MNSRQTERQAARWLAQSESGDFSNVDRAAMQAWLDADTAHRVAWLRLQAAWRQADRLKVLAAGLEPRVGAASECLDAPCDFRSRRWPTGSSPPRNRRAHLAAVASMILAIALGGYAWHRYNTVQTASFATVIGAIESVALMDGSEATLSSDSRIKVAYSYRQRDIDLERGEAYFVVSKDPRRPFVVEAAGHDVVAVGTRFSVRRDGTQLRVVVSEGMVRLQDATDPAAPATLLPAGSIALVDAHGTLTRRLSSRQVDHYLDWRHGYVSFHDTPLRDAVAELNRYHRHKIRIADTAIADLRIGGNFQWANTRGFVRLLEQGFPVTAERHGEDIVLHAK